MQYWVVENKPFLTVVVKYTQEKDMLRKAAIFITWNWNMSPQSNSYRNTAKFFRKQDFFFYS